MKTKITLAIALIGFVCTRSTAQISVTNADVAPFGDIAIIAHDTIPAPSILAGPAGASQTWNFSALKNIFHDSLAFETPASTHSGSRFPLANACVITNKKQNAYLINNTSSLSVLGAAAAISIVPGITDTIIETFAPSSKIMQWPSTMGTTYTDNYMVTAKAKLSLSAFGYDSIRIKNITTSNTLVDAWGNVTTPLGTFATIRQMRVSINIDTTWIHRLAPPSWLVQTHVYDTITHYAWWTSDPTVGFPLCEMDNQKRPGMADTATNITWMQVKPSPQSVIELSDLNTLSVFPNPANNFITVRMKTGDVYTISVMDMTGRIVSAPQVLLNETTSVSTASLNNGMYFLIVMNKDGNRGVKRFSVVR
jgi:hypothetical protein